MELLTLCELTDLIQCLNGIGYWNLGCIS